VKAVLYNLAYLTAHAIIMQKPDSCQYPPFIYPTNLLDEHIMALLAAKAQAASHQTRIQIKTILQDYTL